MTTNKKIWLVAFLISALVITYFTVIITDTKTFAQTLYNQQIAEREAGSVNMTEAVYTTEKTFFLTHSDGASVTMKIVKFKCCTKTFAIANISQQMIGFDYMNKVWVNQVGTTTKQQVPQLYLTSVVHEVGHLASLHALRKGLDLSTREAQESFAYDLEFLLSQIIELSNDGYISLQII